jgi:branched-chain amino acid transport system ATP-binding protein
MASPVSDVEGSNQPVLEVSNLEVVYHSVVLVLKGVSLRVEPSQVVALLGPNGAGKTTTLRALTGLLDIHDGAVTKGNLRWDGQNLEAMAADSIIRSGLGIVMEGRRIFADMTVEENLLAGAIRAPRSQVSEDLERWYERFPILGERRGRLAGYLSGGEQQMLAIARALMNRPKMLLLDEPSLGLAPQVVADVASLIREIHAEGVGILIVEQNASLALELCDHAYIMESGRIVIDGTPDQLRADRDVQEFYLGLGSSAESDYRDAKRYRRKRRWLA